MKDLALQYFLSEERPVNDQCALDENRSRLK